MKQAIPFIDLFAGCGGLSLGLEQAGFSPIFANEIWEPAATTYRLNRGLMENQVFVGDINYLVEHLLDFKFPKRVAMVCGGPPCQGFSMANRQRVIDDPRNQLYKAYLRFFYKNRLDVPGAKKLFKLWRQPAKEGCPYPLLEKEEYGNQ